MSDRVREWLRKPTSAKELQIALDLLHKNDCEPTEVTIEGRKYIIKLAQMK